MRADEPANGDGQTATANCSAQTVASSHRTVTSSDQPARFDLEPNSLTQHPMPITFREACEQDLPAIAELLSDDMLGATRDGPAYLPSYQSALRAIQAQAGNSVIVATLDDEVVGMLQLTFIPGLSRGGMLRAQIESVRVSSHHRGRRIGRALFEHAITLAQEAGCGLVQLTTDKQRPDARRFYESLGFKASHEGMKLAIPE